MVGGNFFREAIEFLVNEALYIQLLVLIITSPIMVNERLAVSMSNWVLWLGNHKQYFLGCVLNKSPTSFSKENLIQSTFCV
jgi:hypothetical protein